METMVISGLKYKTQQMSHMTVKSNKTKIYHTQVLKHKYQREKKCVEMIIIIIITFFQVYIIERVCYNSIDKK